MVRGEWASSFFLIFVFSFSRVGNLVRGNPPETDQALLKYVARDEVEAFLNDLNAFGEEYGKTWMMLPDGDGEPNFALLRNMDEGRSDYGQSRRNEEDIRKSVKFYFYTKNNRSGIEITPANVSELEFDPSWPIKIISHGWMASSESSAVEDIRDAYLEHQDVNVIAVDWSDISKNLWYPSAASSTQDVGKYLGTLIDALVSEKHASYDKIHLIGHSLGAHVSGSAGSSTKKKIGRITGLDPALPGFQFSTYVKVPEERLDGTDADFVDVIHTCAGILGMSITIGHADFYPNGGSPFQPGCKDLSLPTVTQACSHGRAHQFFTESVKHKNFKAVKCSDWDHFKNKKCKNVFANMGEYVQKDARGAFYLKTEANQPFALGLKGTQY